VFSLGHVFMRLSCDLDLAFSFNRLEVISAAFSQVRRQSFTWFLSAASDTLFTGTPLTASRGPDYFYLYSLPLGGVFLVLAPLIMFLDHRA